MTHNNIKNQIAIVGVGSTGYTRGGAVRTARSLAAEAAVKAIRDAGIEAKDIGGVVSSAGVGNVMLVPPAAVEMVSTLSLKNILYTSDGNGVCVGPLIDAMNAIYSGAIDTVLVYHYNYRTPFNSNQAAADPFRRSYRGIADTLPLENNRAAAAYAAWCSRYIYENKVPRETFGYVAINSRTHAIDNPLAAMRTPITMEDYLRARMVRDPLNMLDMDLPVDGAEAFILTTAERAKDLKNTPVLIHSATEGYNERAFDEEQLANFKNHGQNVVVKNLWARSDRTLKDVDAAYLYDGFSIITLSWLERLGWCGYGEAGDFIRKHWDEKQNRILIDGRVTVNSNGGMLSEGGSQAAGFIREAVHQVRGTAGDRQMKDIKTALIAAGGFFFNSQGAILIRG